MSIEFPKGTAGSDTHRRTDRSSADSGHTADRRASAANRESQDSTSAKATEKSQQNSTPDKSETANSSKSSSSHAASNTTRATTTTSNTNSAASTTTQTTQASNLQAATAATNAQLKAMAATMLDAVVKQVEIKTLNTTKPVFDATLQFNARTDASISGQVAKSLDSVTLQNIQKGIPTAVRITTQAPLQAGQLLKVQTTETGQLKLQSILPTPPQQIMAQLIKALVAHQGSYASLLKNLTQLVQQPQHPDAPFKLTPLAKQLPIQTQVALTELIKQLPKLNQVTQPEGLKTAFQNSGLFLESNIGKQDKAVADQIRQLISSLKSSLADPGAANVNTEGAGKNPLLKHGDISSNASHQLNKDTPNPEQGKINAGNTEGGFLSKELQQASSKLLQNLQSLREQLAGNPPKFAGASSGPESATNTGKNLNSNSPPNTAANANTALPASNPDSKDRNATPLDIKTDFKHLVMKLETALQQSGVKDSPVADAAAKMPEKLELANKMLADKTTSPDGKPIQDKVATEIPKIARQLVYEQLVDRRTISKLTTNTLTNLTHPSGARITTPSSTTNSSPQLSSTTLTPWAMPPLPGAIRVEAQSVATASSLLDEMGDALVDALMKNTKETLSRLQLHQLTSASHKSATELGSNLVQNLLSFELPILHLGQISLFQFRVEEELERQTNEESDKPKERKWVVHMGFDLEGLGPMYCQISLAGISASVQFWATNKRTVAQTQQHLATLQEHLAKLGVNVKDLQCIEGEPPTDKSGIKHSLVDIET